mmetsp:Transcript_32413/g.31814  ORF Transcript_32413/g.31814 Transcript_32413/m.31814 type:complete len:83 (+) Transcript_32413:115-363(+)
MCKKKSQVLKKLINSGNITNLRNNLGNTSQNIEKNLSEADDTGNEEIEVTQISKERSLNQRNNSGSLRVLTSVRNTAEDVGK